MTESTEAAFYEWRRLDRLAKISGKKGDHEKAQAAHKKWMQLVGSVKSGSTATVQSSS